MASVTTWAAGLLAGSEHVWRERRCMQLQALLELLLDWATPGYSGKLAFLEVQHNYVQGT